MTRDERIAALEQRIDVLERCLVEIEARLKLKRKAQPLPPPVGPAARPQRHGAPAGTLHRASGQSAV